MRDTSAFSSRLVRAIGTPLEVRRETHGTLPVTTGILGFLSIFKRSQASSHFEALKSACLSRCQKDMRPPVNMRRGTRSFSMASTGDSVIPSSCDMEDKPAFKSLQQNPPSFETGHVDAHYTLGHKHMAPFTYLYLREFSS